MARTKRILVGCCCFLTLVLGSTPATAGAWLQPKRGIYLKLSTNYISTTKEFNHRGERLNIFQERIIYEDTSFRDVNVFAYLEYGVFDRLTVVSTIPFKALKSERTELVGGGAVSRFVATENRGFGDLSLSGRYLLYDGSLVFSVQPGVQLPLGYDAAPANDGPPLGTGKPDFDLHFLMGKSLFPLPAYLSGSLGYRLRTGPLNDQILFTIEAGYSVGPLLAKVTFDGLKSTVTPPDIAGQPITTPLPGGGGAFPNIIVGDQDIFKISPSIILNFTERMALQAEVLHTVAGKNTVAGTIFSLGFVYSR